jgi:hypothetical protein
LALDGCVFTDNQKRCDGLFVLKQARQVFIVLVELKATNVTDTHAQIGYVRHDRREYTDLVEHLSGLVGHRNNIIKREFIIATEVIGGPKRQNLEKYKPRPRINTLGKPNSSAPDLQTVLR